MIRTLVASASDLARAGLAAVVRGDARLSLAGETTPAELERSLAALDPDVLLDDRGNGAPTAQVPIVALVDDARDAWTNGDFGDDVGARAILSRDATPEEIVGAIVAVASGLVAVQPRVLNGSGRFDRASEAERERLTAREIEVLGELARGVPNKIVAVRLGISEHTVKFHVASIFAKLGVSSRTEAVTRGVRLGLIML
jgi:NarL family two-component system response regulator YdfI